jgi:hypothetical protein
MTVARSYPYAKTVDRVLRWCDWYTRGLDEGVARGRRDEILSDLWEHARWAERRNEAPDVTSRVILTRAVLGAFADLNWRRAQRRSVRLAGAPSSPASSGVAIALALTIATTLLVFGAGVLVRGGLAAPESFSNVGSRGLLATAVMTALCALGVALLARTRTRFLGAVWMVPVALGLIHFGLRVLEQVSATVGSFALSAMLTDWDLVTTVFAVAVSLVFGALVAAWWPRHRPHPSSEGTPHA